VFIRVEFDPARFVPTEAGRQHELEFAASGLRIARGNPPLPQQA
jgi:hypothetical protein